MEFIDNILLYLAKFKWYKHSLTYWAFINAFIGIATEGFIFDAVVISSVLINLTCTIRLISLGGWWWTRDEDEYE
jgi:hypothetical protein